MKKIITLTGPSGTGKGYIGSRLRENLGAGNVPVYTTRPRRDADDSSRIFINDAEFDRMVQQGEFWIVDEHFGARYGFSKKLLQDLDNGQGCSIGEVHVDNVPTFRLYFPSTKTIAFVAESTDILERRLKKRGENPDSIARRLMVAEYETRRIFELEKLFDIIYKINESNEGSMLQELYTYLKDFSCHSLLG
jgi:guanylate kinase